PDPKGKQQGKREKENSRQTGHPHIEAGDPPSCLPARSARAVAQSKREQNHADQGEHNKKQQRNEDNGHGRPKVRTKKEKVRRIRRRSYFGLPRACVREILREIAVICSSGKPSRQRFSG